MRCMHSLKSMSAQVGALAVAKLAGQMEDRLRSGGTVSSGDLARLSGAHRSALTAIHQHSLSVRAASGVAA